jgi:hypothetical protein
MTGISRDIPLTGRFLDPHSALPTKIRSPSHHNRHLKAAIRTIW